MAKINCLSPSVYNKIAAGEVVEKPASVVKELVENALDAGSNEITIEVIGGGINSITVTDNGGGIEKEYLKTAFLPHATSKIATEKDLDNIFTLGFRGEALASIAAVSKVTLISKIKESDVGYKLDVAGGEFGEIVECGAKNGTKIIVSDLFYNVPARAKFLRKPKSEEQDVTNIVTRFVLANPGVSIKYYVDNKLVINSPGSSLKDALYSVYGKECINELLPVDFSKNGLYIAGFIARPEYSKPNRTYQTLIINGRYVINSTVSVAVTNAYGETLMKKRYPFYCLNLNIPYDSVDVNVHPNKLDVRFENTNAVFGLVYEAVSRAIASMDYVSEANKKESQLPGTIQTSTVAYSEMNDKDDVVVESEKPTLRSITAPVKQSGKIDKAGVTIAPYSKQFDSIEKQPIEANEQKKNIIETIAMMSSDMVADGFGLGSKLLEKINTEPQTDELKHEKIQASQIGVAVAPETKIVGKVFNTYLLVELDDDLFFIDQHAAHERLLYNKFKAQVDSGDIVIQPLLVPYVLSLSAAEYNMIDDKIEQIRKLGFEIEDFGGNTYKISAVPALLAEVDFTSFVSLFTAENKKSLENNSDLVKDSLMQAACKAAVKGGNDLSKSEIDKLFEDMSSDKILLFCPHGRPIAIRVKKTEIEKWFKRIV